MNHDDIKYMQGLRPDLTNQQAEDVYSFIYDMNIKASNKDYLLTTTAELIFPHENNR